MPATSETHAPFMCTVLVGVAVLNLATLLNAIYSTLTASTKCRFLQLQMAAGGGAAHLYVGNSLVTAVNCGVDLVATQAAWNMNMQSNLIQLGDIYIVSDTAAQKVNVTVMIG